MYGLFTSKGQMEKIGEIERFKNDFLVNVTVVIIIVGFQEISHQFSLL